MCLPCGCKSGCRREEDMGVLTLTVNGKVLCL